MRAWIVALLMSLGTAAAQEVGFESVVFDAHEGDAVLIATVAIAGNATAPIAVDFHTADGTALAGSDYVAQVGQLNWPVGDTTPRTIAIPLLDDGTAEFAEALVLRLTNPQGVALGLAKADGWLLDDDAAPLAKSRLRFDRPRYADGSCLTVQLDDADENRDPTLSETLSVWVGNFAPAGIATEDVETILVKETAEDSGRFVSGTCLPVVFGTGSSDDGQLDVAAGTLIAAAYSDPDNPPNPISLDGVDLAADTAVIAGGTGNGSFTWTVDPSLLDPAFATGPAADPDEAPRPHALVIDDGGGMPLLFGEDMVVLQPGTPEDLIEFLRAYQGSVVEEILPDSAGSGSPPLAYYVIRLDPSSIDLGDFEYWMELDGQSGLHTFSSAQGTRLTALVLHEQLAGREITQNPVAWWTASPTLADGPDSSALMRTDSFQHTCSDTNWRQMTGVDHAIVALDLADRNLARSVNAAVIDGGFASPTEFTPTNTADGSRLDYGAPFASLIQGDCTNRACFGPVNGANTLPCSGTGGCAWHGNGVAGILAGVGGNGYGAMGVAGHARLADGTEGVQGLVNPMLYEVSVPYMSSLARAVRQARLDGASIINVSSGFPCKPLGINICDGTVRTAISVACSAIAGLLESVVPGLGTVLEAVGCNAIRLLISVSGVSSFPALSTEVANAAAADIFFAASGPQDITIGPFSAGNFDAVAVQMAPCFLPGVTCVAGADENLAPASSLAAGGIDIWGPDSRLPTSPSPSTGAGTLSCFSGTSGASPFVAGVAALVRAADPSLSAAQVEASIMTNSVPLAPPATTSCIPHPGMGGCVGLVNAGGSVSAALGGSLSCGGWDESEVRGPHDSQADPEQVVLPAMPSVTEVNTNRAIHTIGPNDDEDWFRFQPPDLGAPSTRMHIEISTDDATRGSLRMRLYRNPPGGANVSDSDLVGNVVSEAPPFALPGTVGEAGLYNMLLLANRTYYLRITGADDTTVDDTCYSNTIRFEVVGAGPQADRYESNDDEGNAATPFENWVHRPHDPQLFEHDISTPFGGFGPGDLWTLHVPDLSLHDLQDRDWYRLILPNPSSIYLDVDPDPGAPEPLVECSDYTRRSDTQGQNDIVRSSGNLRIEIVSTRGVAEPVSILDPPNASLATAWNFQCPRANLGLDELVLSYGDRADDRARALDYELRATYAVPIFRIGNRIPARPFGVLPCPGGWFPDCDESQLLAAAFDTRHPFSLIDPNCLADGCPEDFIVDWPGGTLDVLFEDTVGLDYELKSLEGDLLFVAESFFGGGDETVPEEPLGRSAGEGSGRGNGGSGPGGSRRLYAEALPADFYILTVRGPEGTFRTMPLDSGPPRDVDLVLGPSNDRLTWEGPENVAGYDLLRGSLSQIRDQAGFEGIGTTCLATDQPESHIEDGETPEDHDAFWYLVRTIGPDGTRGSWDGGGPAQLISRDGVLNQQGCP